jgi:hypothetical protein
MCFLYPSSPVKHYGGEEGNEYFYVWVNQFIGYTVIAFFCYIEAVMMAYTIVRRHYNLNNPESFKNFPLSNANNPHINEGDHLPIALLFDHAANPLPAIPNNLRPPWLRVYKGGTTAY